MITNNLEVNLKCTGCTACKTVCPKNAIEMCENENGFVVPVIDDTKCVNCNLCDNVCPQLNYHTVNYGDPDCYAVKAEKNILDVSSSGGAFSVLANYVLKKKGFVCGAAYDEDYLGVSHIMISDESDLHKLRGSKYVYSKMGTIYEQVKEKLEQKEYVLFSGTPCQIAGLKGVLKKSYERLITVDLICSGLPPETIFSKYVEEVRDNRNITSINMRPKKYGWEEDGIEIEFEDKSDYMIHAIRDPYLKGYLNKLFNSEACYDCKYAKTPRIADFTIGDFWHIDKYFTDENFTDGVSCILLNSEKSEWIFDEIKNDFSYKKKVPYSFLASHNMMIEKRKNPLARPRFFNLINNGMKFGKAVDMALNWKFDVAVTGCWSVKNYGGALTYYALYSVLKDMGYTVIMVESRKNIPGYDVPKQKLFIKSPYPYYDISRIHKSFEDQKELNNRVRNFVIGSDQAWNYRLMSEEEIASFSLDYVDSYRKRISYATSFGSVRFPGYDEQKEKFKQLISKFDYVSVREDSGCEILKNDFGIDGVSLLDPVFLCDKKHFDELIQNANISTSHMKYVFTYFIWPYFEKYGLLEVAERLDLGLINTINASQKLLDNIKFSEATWIYPYESNLKVENWLKYLRDSSFILTDSFHAVCFAIVFRKTFVYVKGNITDDDGLERVTSILKKVDLLDRIVKTTNDILLNPQLFEEIDYDLVYEKLEPYKIKSYNWLKNAIQADKEVD